MITILDTNNLLYTIKKKFGVQHKLDYDKLFVPRSIAVGFEARAFENFLRETGYEVYFTDGAYEQGYSTAMLMAQAFRIEDSYIRIGSNDKMIVPLIQVLKGKGVYVEVVAAGIPREIRMECNKWTEFREADLCPIITA